MGKLSLNAFHQLPRPLKALEVLALIELAMGLAIANFDPLPDGMPWADALVALLVLALTIRFTRWGSNLAWILITLLTALAIPATIYLMVTEPQELIRDWLYDLAYLSLFVVSLIILGSKLSRDWGGMPNTQDTIEPPSSSH